MNVLIALDDSEFARYVADFVLAHEWPADSQFTLLHVLPNLLPITAALPPPMLVDLKQQQFMAGRALLDQYMNEIRKKGFKVITELLEGDPKRHILHIAREINADVIVMGSHGRSGIERLMLGSVSLSTASGAHCSVMIVRPPDQCNKNKQQTATQEKELVS